MHSIHHRKRITRLFLLVISLVTATVAVADDKLDIAGVWLNEKGDGLIRIERDGASIKGTIIGAPDGSRTSNDARDEKNPDPALRDRRLIGLVILGEYKPDGDQWIKGQIYDPDVGKYYKSKITLRDSNTLEVRGYVGVSLFGKSQVWTRFHDKQ